MEGKGYNMDIKKVKIEDISINKKNSIAFFNHFYYIKLVQFIKKFGQIQLISVCKVKDEYELIDGYYVLKAMRELNKKEVYINDYGKLSKNDKNLFIIGMRGKFEKDIVKLAYKFKELQEEGNDIDNIEPYVSFYKGEIKNFPELLEFDFKGYDKNLHNNLYLENNEEYF